MVEAEATSDFSVVPGPIDGLSAVPGDVEEFVGVACGSPRGGGTFAASRGGEVTLKKLAPQERQ
eukprot:5567621-Pyramimonas_sp.AAC.1